MALIPNLAYAYKLNLPSELNFWIRENNRSPILRVSALKYPKIFLTENGLEANDDLIFYEYKGYLFQFSIKTGEKTRIFEEPYGYYVILDGKIIPIKTSEKKEIFDQKYNKYNKILDTILLENKSTSLIYFNGNFLQFDKPNYYYVNEDFISLVYDDKTLAIDKNTLEKFKVPIKGNVIGRYNDAIIVKDNNNIIYIVHNNDRQLLGICSSEAYYIGKLGEGHLILCGNELKFYDKESWSYLGRSKTHFGHANSHYAIIPNYENSVILNEDLSVIGKLDRLISAYIIDHTAFILNEDLWLGSLELNNMIEPIEIERENIGYKLCLNNKYFSLNFSKFDLYYEKTDESCYIVEPKYLISKNQAELVAELKSPFHNYEIKLPVLEYKRPIIDIFDKNLIVALDGGKSNLDPTKNAILIAKIKYNIETKRKINIIIEVDRNVIELPIDNGNDRTIDIKVPVSIIDTNNKILRIFIKHNNIKELVREYLIKPEERNKPKNVDPKILTKVIDNECIKEKIISDEYFTWTSKESSICEYNSIVVGKLNDHITLEGKEFIIDSTYREVEIIKENYKRKYLIIGIENPVKINGIMIKENSLIIQFETYYPVEILYGLHVCRGYNIKLCEFPLDPIADKIIFKSYIGNIIVRTEFHILDHIKSYIKEAIINAITVKQQLENIGLL